MINYNIDINCEDPKISTSQLELVSGDVGAYNLSCAFLNDGKRMDLTGLLPTLKAKRADGVILSQAGEIKDNRAVFKLENGIYSVPGELCLEIALSDSAKNYVTTKVIIANVIKGLGDTDEVAKTAPSVYVTLLNQTQEKLSSANSLLLETKDVLDDVYTKDETDAKLSGKANVDNVYTKAETDNLLNFKPDYVDLDAKADIEEVYSLLNTKPDYVDLDAKADIEEVYSLLNTKPDYADFFDYYTKSETDALLSDKADIDTLKEHMGDIETALDNIIALQNTKIGGGSV